MLSQNRLRWMAMKHNIITTSQKCQKVFKYSILSTNIPTSTSTISTNSIIYPMPLQRNSRSLMTQAPIPLMPVPKLESSMSKFLTAVKPLLNEDEFETTKNSASEFIKEGGVGEKLQKLLEERATTRKNWLSQWWLDKVYLEPRYSLIIACNPATLYPRANYETIDQQLSFATKYIFAFLEYKKYLEENKLPVDKMGDKILCMDQYSKCIGSCRVPNQFKDDFKIFQPTNIDINKTNHIAIMYNNRIFKLQVIDPKTGLSATPSEILNSLRNLVQTANEKGMGLGGMTAADRDSWYQVYNELSKNENNRKNLETIQDSFFVLCLDGEGTLDANGVDTRSLAMGQMLHGNTEFTSNRWFDKTVQVIIGQNGVWGTNYEHSVGEAPAHIVMHDFIYKLVLQNNEKLEEVEMSQVTNRIEELNFEIAPSVHDTILTTSLLTNKFIDNLELYVLNFDAFGKNFPKSQKISPDAFVQLAFQLAFYRTQNQILGNCYESGSLRKFPLGRTEIIRTCSSEAAAFVRAMLSNASLTEKSNLYMKAIASHRQLTIDAMNCESFDRHLFGLKQIALENQYELPELYEGVGFKKLNHFYISSSQISSKFEVSTSYGPLVDDGYGSAYNIMENRIIVGVSALKSCSNTDAKLFGSNIRQSLLDCQSILLKVNSKL